MESVNEGLRAQVEAAYDYRGHVTIRLKSGEAAEGFIFNRQWQGPRIAQSYIEVFLKGSAEKRRFWTGDIASVEMTGEDCAAGKSYTDYLKKKEAERAK